MKKTISVFLAMVISFCMFPSMDSFAATNACYKQFSTKSVSLSPSTIPSLNVNNDNATDYMSFTIEDNTLKISGVSTIDVVPVFADIKSLGNSTTVSGSKMYFVTVPNGDTYTSFETSLYMSTLSSTDGQYRIRIFASNDYTKEIFYNATLVAKDGQVGFMLDSKISTANTSAVSKLSKDYKDTAYFLDKSLGDLTFALADVVKSNTAKGTALTSSQRKYIKEFALSITKGCDSDYEKVKAIYDYVAKNLYYDKNRPSNVGSNPACSNPYINLKAIKEKSSNKYNAKNGKVATNCVGYAAMVTALARSINIPTVVVNGSHHNAEKKSWADVDDINKVNHHWAMCYVNKHWITVDANMGSANYDKDGYNGEWTTGGLTNHTFFDCTINQLSQNYLLKGFYAHPKPGKVTKLTASPGKGKITVKYAKQSNVSGYSIYYSKSKTTGYKLLKNTTSTTYTKTKLKKGTKYYFKVKAYKTINSKKFYGSYSAVVYAKVK